MSNPLFNIQYGLFVITTCDAGKDNGCISNTVAQVTAQPNRISVALNKGNFTTELIQRSGKFTASIISETAEVFRKAGVSVWECRNCGHIIIGTEAPDVCPVCFHPQSYFEINAENY